MNTLPVRFAIILATATLTVSTQASKIGDVDNVNAAIANAFKSSPAIAAASQETRQGGPLFDVDGDGVADNLDNCIGIANADQRDSNGDGIGSLCDSDLNQDCIVNAIDLGIFRAAFFGSDVDADFDGSGVVNAIDLGIFKSQFFTTPGPSGLPNACAVTLTMSGTVTGTASVSAPVTATLDGTANGGGIVMFTTTAAADGSYTLPITAPAAGDFVTLIANGTADRSFVRLQSYAGSVARLSSDGGDDGTVNSAEATTLDIDQLSTSLSVLVAERDGAQPQTDAQFAATAATLESSLLIDLATLVRMYTDFPGLTLPDTTPNTLTFIADPFARRIVFDIFKSVLLPTIDDLAIAIANDERIAYSAGQLPESLYISFAQNLRIRDGRVLQLTAGGAAVYTDGSSSGSGAWSIDANGRVIVDFAPALFLSSDFPTIEDPENPGQFIQALRETFLEQVQIDRLVDGDDADHVFVLNRTRQEFPDYPQIAAEITAKVPGRGTARIAFDSPAPFPLSADDLAGSGIVASFYHSDNASEGTTDPRLGSDTLDFNADGTGSSRRRGFTFDWSVSPGAGLLVTFANGESNRFDYFFDDFDGLRSTLVHAQLNGVGDLVARSLLLPRDETLDFDLPQLENKRFRSRQATTSFITPPLKVFDFIFSPGGTACRNPGSSATDWIYSVVDGRMELTRTLTSDGTLFFFRTWQPVQTRPDGYWVIEMLQVALGDPAVDSAVTPGRLNFYSLEQDLASNARPVLGTDSYTIAVDTSISIFSSVLVGNDVDPDGDEVLIREYATTSTFGGTITEVYDVNFDLIGVQYTPAPGFIGTDTFEYRGSDLFCYSDPLETGIVEITVE